MPDFELDVDTSLAQSAPGSYSGQLTSRWDVGGGMNGGYLAAFCLRGVLAESALPDPISMTLHYLSRPEPGQAHLRVEAMRIGRGHASFRFDLLQVVGDEAVRSHLAGVALTGRLRESGPLDFAPPPPAVPGPDASHRLDQSSGAARAARLWQRLDLRVASAGDLTSTVTSPARPAAAGGPGLPTGGRRTPSAFLSISTAGHRRSSPVRCARSSWAPRRWS